MRLAQAGSLAVLVGASFAAMPAAASTPPKVVTVGDFFYSAHKVAVHPGSVITWQWTAHSGVPHTVSVRSGPARFSSATMASGAFSHRFTKRGTYRLHCQIHPSQMTMTVVVR